MKHTVLDANFEYVSEVMFDPTKGEPISSHDISKLRVIVYVTSM